MTKIEPIAATLEQFLTVMPSHATPLLFLFGHLFSSNTEKKEKGQKKRNFL
jgi:hypothetical protein